MRTDGYPFPNVEKNRHDIRTDSFLPVISSGIRDDGEYILLFSTFLYWISNGLTCSVSANLFNSPRTFSLTGIPACIRFSSMENSISPGK